MELRAARPKLSLTCCAEKGKLLLAIEFSNAAVPSLYSSPNPSVLVLESASSKFIPAPNPPTLPTPNVLLTVFPFHPINPHIIVGCILQNVHGKGPEELGILGSNGNGGVVPKGGVFGNGKGGVPTDGGVVGMGTVGVWGTVGGATVGILGVYVGVDGVGLGVLGVGVWVSVVGGVTTGVFGGVGIVGVGVVGVYGGGE